MTDLFKLHKDYRREEGGIGALFQIDKVEKKTEEKIDDFFNTNSESS